MTPKLFDGYTVDDGRIHLGGCTLEDRPILRLTYRLRPEEPNAQSRLTHVYLGPDYQPVDDELVASLHLDEIEPLPARAPQRLPKEEVEPLVEAGKRVAEDCLSGADVRLIAKAVVWCKYAHGKLSFVIGDHSADLPFDGWAQHFANDKVDPPMFVCPVSGVKSYHVAATVALTPPGSGALKPPW